MPRTKNEKVLSKRREKKSEYMKKYREKERRREINIYVDVAYHRIINGNHRNETIYSYTEFIKVTYPAIHKEIIKVLFENKDFLRVEKNRIYNLLRVRDIIPEYRLQEVLKYQEFLENL